MLILLVKKNGLVIPLQFQKVKSRVSVEGKIRRGNEELYTFMGYWTEQPLIAIPINPDYAPALLFDKEIRNKSVIAYPEPFQVPDLNTFKVWGTVTESIVRNDMNNADIEKKKIEAEQRRRIKQWDNSTFIYFTFDEQLQKWVFSKKKGTVKHKAS